MFGETVLLVDIFKGLVFLKDKKTTTRSENKQASPRPRHPPPLGAIDKSPKDISRPIARVGRGTVLWAQSS